MRVVKQSSQLASGLGALGLLVFAERPALKAGGLFRAGLLWPWRSRVSAGRGASKTSFSKRVFGRAAWEMALGAALLFSAQSCTRGAEHPPTAARHVFSLHDYDSSRYRELMALLRDLPGVYEPKLDCLRMQVALFSDPGVTTASIRAAALHKNFRLQADGQTGSYLAPAGWAEHSDVLFLNSDGEDFDVLPLSRGKFTIVEFSASWCHACHALENELKRLLVKRDDIAVRVVDIGDFGSPAQQHWFPNLRALPFVVVHSKAQQVMASQAGFAKGWVQRALRGESDK